MIFTCFHTRLLCFGSCQSDDHVYRRRENIVQGGSVFGFLAISNYRDNNYNMNCRKTTSTYHTCTFVFGCFSYILKTVSML